MIKLQIKYQSEEEKQKMIRVLSAESIIKNISKSYKSKGGKYYRVYLDIEG